MNIKIKKTDKNNEKINETKGCSSREQKEI